MKFPLVRLGAWRSALLLTLAIACNKKDPSPSLNPSSNESARGMPVASVTPSGSAAPKTLTDVTIVLNWLVEPPHGGYFAALLDGLYEARGLNVHLTPGGPNVAGYALLGSGKTEFAQLNASGTLSAREQGIPIVAVFAELQDSPQILMFHKDKPVKDFADLAGRKVAVTPGDPYWDFLMAKFALRGKVTQVNFSGQSATFMTDKSLVQQGYAVAEPFTIKKQAGEEVGQLLVADGGFNPYGVLATNEEYIQKHGDVVRAVVEASREGWKRFVADPKKYAPALKAANRDLDDAFLSWSSSAVVPFVQGKSQDTKEHGLGWMTEARWNDMYTALKGVKVLKKDQDPKKAFTTAYLQPAAK
jgi:NitT/TauT family transport system substrate-binding protein